MKKLFALLLTMFCFYVIHAQTTVGGAITTNTVWNLAGSPYTVTSSVTVNSGVTLTIETGVEVKFNDNLKLDVLGTLSATGATFTSNNVSPTPGIWTGIELDGNTSNTITSCQILYAANAINASLGSVNLSGTSITSTQYSGVYVSQNTFNVRNAITADNLTISGATNAIYLNRASLTLTNSSISNVSSDAIVLLETIQASETNTSNSSISTTTITGNSAADGIAITKGTLSINDVTVTASRYPVKISGPADVSYTGTNSFTNNTYNVIYIPMGSINDNFVLRNSGYVNYFSGTITVENGYEMSIDSESILKFNPNIELRVKGKLTAIADPGETIYFTSWYDDNQGGDSNGDANDTSPSTGKWYGIHFYAESDDASVVRRANIRWINFYGAVNMTNASPTIDSCTLSNGYYGAVFNEASSPTFTNNTIASSDRTPVAMSFDANPVFTSNSFSTSDNTYDAIGLLGGIITQNSSIIKRDFTDLPNVTYMMFGDVTVPENLTMTIAPGVVIKNESGYDFIINGELLADGTPTEPIVFTSVNDDLYGNPLDTRNDGTTLTPNLGNMGGFYFSETSDNTSIIDNCIIKFAEYNPNFFYQDQYGPVTTTYPSGLRFLNRYEAAIAINRSEPTISNNTITDVDFAIDVRGLTSPVISNNTVVNSVRAPFRIAIQSTPSFSGNTFNSVGWNGLAILPELINYTATLSPQPLAGEPNALYIIEQLGINEGASITIDPGVFIKMDRFDQIYVFGGLKIAGTANEPVTITTIADDNTGPYADPLDNDTQSNGNATEPGNTEWGSIRFHETSDDVFSLIRHANLLYGGYVEAPVQWFNAAARMDSTEISFSQGYGLWFSGASTPMIDNVSISTCNSDPLAMSYFADPTFTNISFDANGSNGIRLIDLTLGGNATIRKRDIAGINNIGYIMSYLTINNGATLTVNPGVVIKMNTGSSEIIVNEGAMNAQGTVDEPIIFTSLSDDSRGGDTNIDGNGSVPAPGNWWGLEFRESTIQSVLKYVEVRYGGRVGTSQERGTILSENNNLLVDNCVVQLSSSSAFGIYGTSTATITNNRLENINEYPVHMAVFSNPTFGGNTIENVKYVGISIKQESINQTATIPFRSFAGIDSITYIPDTWFGGGTLTINSGTKLTVPAGMHFKYDNSQEVFNVNGELHIAGTADNPVVFTSIKDDEYGRPLDTENNGLPTSINYSSSVASFKNVSNDASLVEHAIIRYRNPAFRLESASPTFDNNLIENSEWGILSTGISEPVITNNTFHDLTFTPFKTSMVAFPSTLSGNTLSGSTWKGIYFNDETLTQDTTLVQRSFAGINNIPYILRGYIVGLGVKLTIDPGVILKFDDATVNSFSNLGYLYVKGALAADGGASSDSTIIFTSINDDFYGGDTDSNGALVSSTSLNYEWNGIRFENESSDSESILDNVIVRAARNYGVELQSASPTISNSLFIKNGTGSTNYGGLYVTGASNPALSMNDFIENNPNGISNTGSFQVDATGSWWGDNSGPYEATNNPDGQGDQVLGNVLYDPWSTNSAQNPITGDVSLNGHVTAFDAALTLQDVAALITFSDLQDRVGDVSDDGSITAMDASYILQFAAGLIQWFPAEAENKRVNIEFAPTYSDIQVALGDFFLEEGMEFIEIPMTLSNVKDLYAFESVIALDPLLEFVEFRQTGWTDEVQLTRNFLEDKNELRMAFALVEGLDEDKELGTLILRPKQILTRSALEVTLAKVVGNETEVTRKAVSGTVTVASAILSADLGAEFTIYPNPASEYVDIQLARTGDYEITMHDLNGRQILNQELHNESSLRLSLKNLHVENGVYLLKVHSQENTIEHKVIINR